MAEFIFPTDALDYYADEVGLSLAGLIRRESDGSPRVGMIAPGPSVEAVAASWKVQVSPFTHVHHLSGSIRFTGQSASEQVDITPATTIPAGQARIDLVAWDLDERELFVIEGTPGTSPTAPAYGGMVPVAEVRVNSGDGMVIAGQVTAVYETTALAGDGRKARGVVAARSVGAHDQVAVPIVFPSGKFTEPPVVLVSHSGSGTNPRDTGAAYRDVTKDGFTFLLTSTSPVVRTIGGSWSAEQA